MNMYQSPIEVFATELQTSFAEAVEADIVNVVQRYGINVNKEELIKALDYDRQQYEEGYRDGKNADRWISVNEETPKKGGTYIVATAGFVTVAWFRSGSQTWETPSGLQIGVNDGIVTHWMPMPELPEGVKRKKETNYDHIRNMTVEEMVTLFKTQIGCGSTFIPCGVVCNGGRCMATDSDTCRSKIKQWLLQEVSENDR